MSGGGVAGILLILLLVVALFIAASCVKIVPQASAYVVESLGKYKDTWATGLHFKVPFIERVAIRVNLKEQVVDFPPQPVITKDNVTMQIDTVVFFQITDGVAHRMSIFTKEIRLVTGLLVLFDHTFNRRIHTGIHIGHIVHSFIMDITVVYPFGSLIFTLKYTNTTALIAQ